MLDRHLDDATLAALVEGTATAAARQAALAHADGCPDCRALVAAVGRAALAPSAAEAVGAPHVPLARGVSVGRYLVMDLVGAGATGEVHAAYDPALERRVALKILRPDMAGGSDVADLGARLLREAQALANLSHPNVVAVHDAGLHGEQLFIAMELVEGRTLRAWLGERGRGWRDVLRVLVAAGRGLEAAHAVGIVHRDVKPENILVGADGRVRVADFGLARKAFVKVEAAPADATIDALTQTGALLGTPAYMAPEQLRGEPATALSDQFSFCATLHEALFGRRPFAGGDLGSLLAAIERGVPDKDSDAAPTWVRRAITRGLRAAPGERFPSMTALLAALERDPRRRLWGAAAVAVMVAAMAGAVAIGRQAHSETPCLGGEAELAEVWNPARKQAVRAALTAGGASFAPAVADSVERALEAHTAAWLAMRQEACEATHVRATQSPALLDLRMACLYRDRDELRALVDVFAQPGPSLAAQAVKAAYSLPPLRRCSAEATVAARTDPPAPAVAAQVDKLRRRIAEGRALLRAARYQPATEAAQQLVTDARATGYAPIEAEAELFRGAVAAEQHQLDDAIADYTAAFRAGAVGGDERTAAQAEAGLAWVVGVLAGKRDDGRDHARWAQVLDERLGDDALRADLAYYDGIFHHQDGDYDAADADFRRALAERQRLFGADHPQVAAMLTALGLNSRMQGRLGVARAYYERALAMDERLLGKDHPGIAPPVNDLALARWEDDDDLDGALALLTRAQALAESLGAGNPMLGSALVNRGAVLADLGDYPQALDLLERGVAIEAAAFAPENPLVLYGRWELGATLVDVGRYEEARAQQRQALEVRERTLGAEHYDVAASLDALAAIDERTGHREAALAGARRALAIAEKILPPGHPGLASCENTLCDVLARQDAGAETLAACGRALAANERAFGPAHSAVAVSLAGLGEAQLGAGRPDLAIPPLELAVGIVAQHDGHLALAARVRFDLARALGPTPRALELARAARAALVRVASADHRDLDAVDAWLAQPRR